MAGGLSSLIGCGGGSAVAGLSSGGTGSVTTGTVKGLGSIIVNGVRYDTSRAVVQRINGSPAAPVRPGMVVTVDASSIAAAPNALALPTATAFRISYWSEWTGKVDSVDIAGRTINLLGQTVEVPASAFFEGLASDLTLLTTQHFVEVYGYLNVSTSRLLATRVEVSNSAPAGFVLSGQVRVLDTAARTFRLGSALISYDVGAALPTSFADGLLVQVRLDPTPIAGAWRAIAIQAKQSALAQLQVLDREDSEIHGVISSFEEPTRLTVNGGIQLDISRAAISGTPAIGAPLEAHGAVVAGVLMADRLEIKTEAQLEPNEFDFIGAVSSLDTVARTFRLQDLGFLYSDSTVINVPGWVSAATPAVRVKAVLTAGNWIAIEIGPEA
ncbi:MAG: hypothetical protein NVS2B4_09570 [Ramlibacter sp.]